MKIYAAIESKTYVLFLRPSEMLGWRILRDQLRQRLSHPLHIKISRRLEQRLQRLILTDGVPAGAQHHDLVVPGLEHVFACGDELLVEFFAGSQARELDLYFGRLLAREHDEIPGQVGDAHGLAHFEHENFSALPEGSGLDVHLLKSKVPPRCGAWRHGGSVFLE